MKKVYLLLTIALLISLIAPAQQLNLIIKVGGSFSKLFRNFEINNLENTIYYGNIIDSKVKFREGFILGAGLEINISEKFFLQPEMMFVQKGEVVELILAGGSPNVSDFLEKIKLRLNYLEVPVLAKFKFGSKNYKLHLNAGPSIAFGLSGKNTTERNEMTFNDPVKFGSAYSRLKRIDFGFQLGAGVSFQIRPNHNLVFDLRYGIGLSDLNNTAMNKVKSRTAQCSVEYIMPLSY